MGLLRGIGLLAGICFGVIVGLTLCGVTSAMLSETLTSTQIGSVGYLLQILIRSLSIAVLIAAVISGMTHLASRWIVFKHIIKNPATLRTNQIFTIIICYITGTLSYLMSQFDMKWMIISLISNIIGPFVLMWSLPLPNTYPVLTAV